MDQELSWDRSPSLWREWVEDRRRRWAARGAAREALELIDRDGCENFTVGRCWDVRGRRRGAEHLSEAWCGPCIARDALNRIDGITRSA